MSWNQSYRSSGLKLLALTCTLAVGGSASAAVLTALSPFFKQVVTNANAQNLVATASFDWLPLPGNGPGDGAVGLVVGQGSLISVRFAAESLCSGGGTDFGWCGIRIMIDGIEAEPAPGDYAFDSTNNGAEGSGSWEGHALERHLCIPNPRGVTRVVPVQVEWAVFNQLDAFPNYRIDDTSLTIESSIALGACVPFTP